MSPINVRIDIPKGKSNPLPIITIKLENRTLSTSTHALDVISQNLEEIRTIEEKMIRRSRPQKTPPINIHLNNMKFSLVVHEFLLFD